MSPKNIRAARTSEALLRTERHALLEHLGNTRKPGRMRWERWRRAGQLAGLPRFGALSFRPTARLTSVGRMPGQGQPLEVDLKLNGLLFRFGAVAKKVDWPYDDDPMALRIGKRRDGRPAVTIAPTGTGLVGRF